MKRKKPIILMLLALCIIFGPSLFVTIFRGGLISLESVSANDLNTTYHMNLQNIKDTQIKKYFDSFYFLTHLQHATYYEVFISLEDAHLQLYIDRYANRASYEVVDTVEVETSSGTIVLDKCTVEIDSTAEDRSMFLFFTFDTEDAYFSGMLMPHESDYQAELTKETIDFAEEVIMNTCIAPRSS